MKLIFPCLVASGLILFSCHSQVDSTNPMMQPEPLDMASQDSSVRPQDNFFLFANGTWLKTTEIPPSQFSWGAFSTLLDSSLNRLNRILDSLGGISNAIKGSIAQQTGDLYVSAMDSAGIEKKDTCLSNRNWIV
jgi:putative endopeptidase